MKKGSIYNDFSLEELKKYIDIISKSKQDRKEYILYLYGDERVLNKYLNFFDKVLKDKEELNNEKGKTEGEEAN